MCICTSGNGIQVCIRCPPAVPSGVKPPLGLIPEKFYNEARIQDILDAMKRYNKANKVFPLLWVEELERRIFEN